MMELFGFHESYESFVGFFTESKLKTEVSHVFDLCVTSVYVLIQLVI